MKKEIERNLGEQPIAKIMKDLELTAQDLVKASTEQITHKMVSRAGKGRRLTPRVQVKIRTAINTVADREFSKNDLFTY